MSGEAVVATSSVYHNGMTHLPAKIRKYLEIKDGDTVLYSQDYDGHILLSKGKKLSQLRRRPLGKYR